MKERLKRECYERLSEEKDYVPEREENERDKEIVWERFCRKKETGLFSSS